MLLKGLKGHVGNGRGGGRQKFAPMTKILPHSNESFCGTFKFLEEGFSLSLTVAVKSIVYQFMGLGILSGKNIAKREIDSKKNIEKS